MPPKLSLVLTPTFHARLERVAEREMTSPETWACLALLDAVRASEDRAQRPTRPARSRLEWARFTQLDWHAFSGAESLADGSDPFVADLYVDGIPALAVLDGSGFSVFVVTDEETRQAFSAPYPLATILACAVRIQADSDDLVALGATIRLRSTKRRGA
jgi:hypothetical protein